MDLHMAYFRVLTLDGTGTGTPVHWYTNNKEKSLDNARQSQETDAAFYSEYF